MFENIFAFVILFTLSIGTALLVFAIFRRSLRSLLDEVVKISSGTTFYLRIFLICLVFIALSSALNIEFDLKKGSAFMEYVWKVAEGLSSVFGTTTLFLVAYVVLVTILIAVLRHRNDQ